MPHTERATLRRCQRLLKTGEFRTVYAARARVSDGRLVVYARPNGRPTTRLGLSVGRRVGGSVARTRIRRLLREAFRRARAEWPRGYDLVIVPVAGPYAFDDVDRSLRTLVPQAIRRSDRAAKPEAHGGGRAER